MSRFFSDMFRNYRVFPGDNLQVSRFPEKSPDSRNNFGFVPKQRLLELSPPVILINRKEQKSGHEHRDVNIG